jgi:hypothetical protein
MKLHLGCGQRYFEGYVNIDYPPDRHTVQTRSIADLQTDLLGLRYAQRSIDEIRLHHVFEHFPRHIACALLAGWQTWLKHDGVLRIEVPDLVLTGLAAINPFLSIRRRCIAERHLFGSHEAKWAAHKESYSAAGLRRLVEAYGFAIARVNRNSWRGTYNFDLTATKSRTLSRADCDAAARTYLGQFLIDDSESEMLLLDAWLTEYGRQADICWSLES